MQKERGIETIEVVIILLIIAALGFAFRYILVEWYNFLIKGAEEQVMNGQNNVPHGL
ncbi:hypothetical protein [endosymbiont 'TC1' of Trimyema compressum]|uniref:hypothetical protein n=1 Tax=endosymbiont 'TC1' of Trimyema compressum TaxID=243899 RepID=UPI0013922A7C|nr:hypothetical protein [endosymbiont 'TC1' of Trimyema compressum]